MSFRYFHFRDEKTDSRVKGMLWAGIPRWVWPEPCISSCSTLHQRQVSRSGSPAAPCYSHEPLQPWFSSQKWVGIRFAWKFSNMNPPSPPWACIGIGWGSGLPNDSHHPQAWASGGLCPPGPRRSCLSPSSRSEGAPGCAAFLSRHSGQRFCTFRAGERSELGEVRM